ncbi:MAG: ABC transporter ATP-binding protein [Candidatus Promineifilaceae bacterium]
MIELASVSFVYPGRGKPALSEINFTAQEGEFILISGPSGSGKSTFLRLLNGLVPHFSGGAISGKIMVDGVDVVEEGPQTLSRIAGFVAQNPEAQSLLETVEPEIAFALENAAIPVGEMHERVQSALEITSLAPLRRRLITTLSGGERQRVALASALALRPKILLLDEPTSQLDPEASAEILLAIQKLNRDLGMTVMLIEHRLERVLPFVDRITYFEEGRISIDAPASQAVELLPDLPPLQEVARALGWRPMPLTGTDTQFHLPPSRREQRAVEMKPLHQKQPLQEMPALLVAEDLHYSYDGRKEALAAASLECRGGETTVIMGANGSGKSTLLRCLIGLLKPSQGDIRLNNRRTIGRKTVDLAREIAYLPQYPDDLLFAESVSEEFETTLRNHGMESTEYVRLMLERLGLTAEAATYPRDLSTGQRQRVALGAITITQPCVLLLDEPTRGLDPVLKQGLVKLWRKWRDEGMVVVIVTHDVELAAQIADKVIIMADGTITSSGNAREVFNGNSSFAPQMLQLFPGYGWLTPSEAILGIADLQVR